MKPEPYTVHAAHPSRPRRHARRRHRDVRQTCKIPHIESTKKCTKRAFKICSLTQADAHPSLSQSHTFNCTYRVISTTHTRSVIYVTRVCWMLTSFHPVTTTTFQKHASGFTRDETSHKTECERTTDWDVDPGPTDLSIDTLSALSTPRVLRLHADPPSPEDRDPSLSPSHMLSSWYVR